MDVASNSVRGVRRSHSFEVDQLFRVSYPYKLHTLGLFFEVPLHLTCQLINPFCVAGEVSALKGCEFVTASVLPLSRREKVLEEFARVVSGISRKPKSLTKSSSSAASASCGVRDCM